MAFVKVKGPLQLLKFFVFVVCVYVASKQLIECFWKLQHPPVSTHYHFSLNDTLKYPAITICRSPPFKANLFPKYGLKSTDTLSYTSVWKKFKFDEFTMEEFFKEATYSFNKIVPFFGLNEFHSNVHITATYNLKLGKCYTLIPKNVTTSWTYPGYFFYFTHDDHRSVVNGASYSGFHVYIHDQFEVFTENEHQSSGFVEYIFLETLEEVQVKLKVSEFNEISTNDNPCQTDYSYSYSQCRKECLNRLIRLAVGCSVPWMNDKTDVTHCSNSNSTKKIIQLFNDYSIIDESCSCRKSCNHTMYSPFIQNRRDIDPPSSTLTINFSSNLVVIMEEILGYDFNTFLADLGGSLGFFLGLSVLGIIGITEQLFNNVRSFFKKEKRVTNSRRISVVKEISNEALNNLKLDRAVYGNDTKAHIFRKIADYNFYSKENRSEDTVNDNKY